MHMPENGTYVEGREARRIVLGLRVHRKDAKSFLE